MTLAAMKAKARSAGAMANKRVAAPETNAETTIVGPTPNRPPIRPASTAPMRNPTAPIENAMPISSGVNPSSRTRKSSRTANRMFAKKLDVPVVAAMLRR